MADGGSAEPNEDANEMIVEVAPLQVRPGSSTEFENAFLAAQRILASTPGYVSHDLRRCIERRDEYLLLVTWQSVEAHEVGFRKSPQYQTWKRLLHHFYDPFPAVSHYEAVEGASGDTRG
jgi:heme-degrading monooxygenase HmoA